MASTPAKKEKMYRVISKYNESKNGIITIHVNGVKYEIPENEPTELSTQALSFLSNAEHIQHLETGADEEGSVDIEKGFSVSVNSRFNIMEV